MVCSRDDYTDTAMAKCIIIKEERRRDETLGLGQSHHGEAQLVGVALHKLADDRHRILANKRKQKKRKERKNERAE